MLGLLSILLFGPVSLGFYCACFFARFSKQDLSQVCVLLLFLWVFSLGEFGVSISAILCL